MPTRRDLLRLAGVGAVAHVLGAACTAAPPPQTATPTPVAAPTAASVRPIATVAAYSALDDATTDALVAAFRSAYPAIAVDVLSRAPIAELWTRIRVERDAPKADVLVGGDSSFHASLAHEGLLEPYPSPSLVDVPAEWTDPSGVWNGWYVGLLAFASNARRLASDLGGQRPAGWDDLVEDAWKGRLVVPDPSKTAAGYVLLATQVFRFSGDEDAAIGYMKALHRNVDRYAGRTGQALDLVAAGGAVGSPAWAADIAAAVTRGAALDLAVPVPTGTGLGAVSLVRGRADRAAAKVLVDHLLGRESGEVLVRSARVLSVRGDVSAPAGVPALGSVRLVAYDRAFAAANRERLIGRWLDAVGR